MPIQATPLTYGVPGLLPVFGLVANDLKSGKRAMEITDGMKDISTVSRGRIVPLDGRVHLFGDVQCPLLDFLHVF